MASFLRCQISTAQSADPGATVPGSIGIAYADGTVPSRTPRRLPATAATHREAAKTRGWAIYPQPALSDVTAALPAGRP